MGSSPLPTPLNILRWNTPDGVTGKFPLFFGRGAEELTKSDSMGQEPMLEGYDLSGLAFTAGALL